MKWINFSRTSTLIIGLFIFQLYFSGIIRHDKKEEDYINLAKQKQFDCVGQVVKNNKESGSCVLISNKYILTAAHILIEYDFEQEIVETNGQKMIFFNPKNPRPIESKNVQVLFMGKKYSVKTIYINPNYLDITKGNINDIAILELDSFINTIQLPILNNNLNELNSKVIGVGFGVFGVATNPKAMSLTTTKKIAGENIIDTIVGYEINKSKAILTCDFDHPDKKEFNKIGSAIPRELEYLATGGDSGGGLFRLKKNKWELVGICTSVKTDYGSFLSDGYYGGTMGWTRVSLFNQWINEVIKK